MKLLPSHVGAMLLLLPAFNAWPQGTVNFNNNFRLPGTTLRACICGPDGRAVARGAWQVEVLDSAGGLIKSGSIAASGVFFLGVIEIPGTSPGGSGSVSLRAWEGPRGSTYDLATTKAEAIITLTQLGGGAIPPPSLATAGNFTGLWPLTVPVASLLRQIVATTGGLEIQGEGCPPTSQWALEASSNLEGWQPAGAPQMPEIEIGQGLWFGMRWTVPESDAPAFFRMTRVP